MGLIKALRGAAGSVLADQWREYFYCDSLEADVLAVKGHKKVSGRSSNTSGAENIISNGSIVAVADGQCMMIVEQGKIVEFSAEPGEYVYDSSTEPTIFYGAFGQGLMDSFRMLGKRFTFGGEAPKDQRVYYFNTKELIGNKYGTPSPVPFRVVDRNIGLDMDISIRCFGEYSYRICDPMLFYKNVCGNITEDYSRESLDGQLKTELMTALQPAFAKISDMGIRYSALPGHTVEIADALNEVLSTKWRNLRGLEIVSFGVSSLKASEEDEALIKELQRNAAFKDPTMAAAHIVNAQAEAMRSAAKNENGAMMGFMGMGFAQQAGGMNAAQLYQMGQQNPGGYQQAPQEPVAAGPAMMQPEGKTEDSWKCPQCGHETNGKFCPECGTKRPEPKPQSQGWTCPGCGKLNKGKFCSECGTKKPAGEPLYRCDKCGWEPEDPKHPPKFCPECGDPFGEEDQIQ